MREKILNEILGERVYQDERWGGIYGPIDQANTTRDWIAYLTHYAGNAYQHPVNLVEFRKRMVKVAALAVAAIEAVDVEAPGLKKEIG